MADKSRFVFQVSSNEIPVAIGGKNFEMKVYDCVNQEFFNVLTIEIDGGTVKVRPGSWSILFYD